ncbi:hypothetical protein WQ54_30860 [Bacillus sp. SA1-12]|uniref:hypothetical protein n=1 Tax=Bacillus sp. SA1-12 TaxID=1455638 RepID=UPI000626F0BC|nr:hypothetical protein [Bacillus sp. SA1-12]KKI88596.1 hypothetical protein WQ54_30860 [Bacillus sp. SA1-12]
MKRLFVFLLMTFLCYIVYYDFQVGTLPALSMAQLPPVSEKEQKIKEEPASIPYFEVKIKQGDTVLTIIEKHHNGLPASIEEIIKDFEVLNSDVKAEEILPGETYRFPNYEQ